MNKMRIGQLYRHNIVDLFVEEAKQTDILFFVDFQGLDANSLNDLRLALRDSGARLLVGKNSLMQKAFEQASKDVASFLGAQTAVVYSSDQVVGVVKILVNFSKDKEQFSIKGGIIKDKLLGSKELEIISQLPPKDVLLGMLVNCMVQPLSAFVNSLNQIILKFLWAIEEVKKQKEKKA
jgi:large subunit ribosomal protein L10